jgi:hypothetical protein
MVATMLAHAPVRLVDGGQERSLTTEPGLPGGVGRTPVVEPEQAAAAGRSGGAGDAHGADGRRAVERLGYRARQLMTSGTRSSSFGDAPMSGPSVL